MSFNQVIEKNGNIIFLEHGSQIKSAIIEKSFKAVDKNGEIVMHFAISELTSIELLDNTIKIFTSDEIPFVIHFASNGEAEYANDRINDMINGQYIA